MTAAEVSPVSAVLLPPPKDRMWRVAGSGTLLHLHTLDIEYVSLIIRNLQQ
jgi:hypothetical protein